jgi:hypothetical protein
MLTRLIAEQVFLNNVTDLQTKEQTALGDWIDNIFASIDWTPEPEMLTIPAIRPGYKYSINNGLLADPYSQMATARNDAVVYGTATHQQYGVFRYKGEQYEFAARLDTQTPEMELICIPLLPFEVSVEWLASHSPDEFLRQLD